MKLRIFSISLTFLCIFTFSQQTRTAFAQSTQNVVWTSTVNATATGNSLQKTGGCNTCADSGAVSQQTITSGDGYVEFTASETTTQRYIGLSNGNPGTTATEIAFAILLSNSVKASVQEHAVYKTEVAYAPGDIFRIAVVAGVVKYYKNGALFYTSTAGTPTYPLLVDTALVNTSATLNNVVISSASGGVSTDPDLPQVFINTTYPTMTGATINVALPPYNGELQAAINSANPGDTILLTPGTTYSGNYNLPEKPNPNGLWIVIRSASTAFDSTGSIPPGTRVDGSSTSTHLAQMPKLRAQSAATAVITINPRANHYRLVGLDVGVPTTITNLINMVEPRQDSYDNSAANRSDLTSYITIDRCFIHGNDNGNFRRGVVLNGNWYAVIDSYVSNFHDSYDSQALNGWSADGPFKISNNYLEAAAENLNFGGTTPTIQGLVPQDIEVSRNHFYKPTSWRDADSIPNHRVKNLFESKSSRRVLITGNIFENCWDAGFTGDGSGQSGHAIVLKSTGRSVTTDVLCTWCVTEHVTITNNIVRHAGGVLVINALETGALLPANHIKVENLLAYDIGTPSWGTAGAPNGVTFDIYNGPSDVQIIHTTTESAYEIVSVNGGISPRFTFRDNIVERQPYGIEKRGEGTLEGSQALTNYLSPYYYRKNVIVNNSDLPTSREPNQVISDSALLAKYPSGETFVATDWNAVGFVNRAGGNYRLSSTSPYKNGASDGKDIGADQNAIEAAIAGNSPQNVVWTSIVNSTLTGTSLKKTGGCSGCDDAGAVSQQTIASGDGYVEFTASETTTQRFIGLSNGNPGTSATEIAFSIKLSSNSIASVQEHAVYKTEIGYVTGDVFRIAVVAGVVKYYKNGALFYTSTAGTPTYPLLVDTSLWNTNATINNAIIKIN